MNPRKLKEGMRFGKWTTVVWLPKSSERVGGWLCKCDCGNTSVIKTNVLMKGRSKSCGCDTQYKRKTKHGARAGGEFPRLYRIWLGMKERCYNKNSLDAKDYGDRGISVCKEWRNDYDVFKKWADTNGYSPSLSIDRIDVNGNYCPENCRWADDFQQARNRRNNAYYEINGELKSLAEWVDIYGANYYRVRGRLRRGWDIVNALTKPKGWRFNGKNND